MGIVAQSETSAGAWAWSNLPLKKLVDHTRYTLLSELLKMSDLKFVLSFCIFMCIYVVKVTSK